MPTLDRVRSTVQWTSGTNLVAGIWMILAPFLLGYAAITAAVWNDVIIGLAVAVLAGTRLAKPLEREGASWTNLVLGLWLIAAPFALGYAATAAALWNDIVIGVVVAALGAWSAVASRDYHPSGDTHATAS